MAELKTKPTKINVEDFINGIADEQKRKDSFAILKLMQQATNEKPKMWGTSIVGFGDVHLKYESGRELDWFYIGLSPRKAAITLYLCGSVQSQSELLKKLGKHKTGKGCLYINKLDDVDTVVLKKLIDVSYKTVKSYK